MSSTSTTSCKDDERAFNTIFKTPTPAATMTTTSRNALMDSATEQDSVLTTAPPNKEHDNGNNEDEKDEEHNKIDNNRADKPISAAENSAMVSLKFDS